MKTVRKDSPAGGSLDKSANDGVQLVQKDQENLETKLTVNKGIKVKCMNDPVIEVIFRDKEATNQYKLSVEKFLREILPEEETVCISLKSSKEDHQNKDEENGGLFRIDKASVETEDSILISDDIPFYSSTYEEYLKPSDGDVSKNDSKDTSQRVSNGTCFNCLANHHLKDCPEELNRSKIAENKKNFRNTLNTSRYHEDEEYRGKYKPGCISSDLRAALKLKPSQLPLYIYNMRVIGYPPGWLKEAEIESSGLFLYGSDGKAVEGDNGKQSSCNKIEYDTDKFIDYPGFNSPLPRGFIDECEVHSLPPMQQHQQLKEAKKQFSSKMTNLYKRSRNNSVPSKDMKKKKVDEVPYQGNVPHFSPVIISTPKAASKSCEPRTPTSVSLETSSISTPEGTNTISTPKSGGSLLCTPGTAVVDRGNPFKKLPDVSKFSVGITEHLPFENLPDAIGTFEKIRGVLNVVRQKRNEFLST